MLNTRQQMFVSEYVMSNNAHDAVRRAGYSGNETRVQASRLLTNADVQAAIAVRRRQLAKSTDITPEKVLIEFGRLAFSDIRDYLQWDEHGVTLVPSCDLTDDQARAIIEISETTTPKGTKTVRFKLSSKQSALEQAAKLMGMVKTEISATVVHEYHEVLDGMSLDDMRALAAEARYNQGQRALGDGKAESSPGRVIEGTYTEQ